MLGLLRHLRPDKDRLPIFLGVTVSPTATTATPLAPVRLLQPRLLYQVYNLSLNGNYSHASHICILSAYSLAGNKLP